MRWGGGNSPNRLLFAFSSLIPLPLSVLFSIFFSLLLRLSLFLAFFPLSLNPRRIIELMGNSLNAAGTFKRRTFKNFVNTASGKKKNNLKDLVVFVFNNGHQKSTDKLKNKPELLCALIRKIPFLKKNRYLTHILGYREDVGARWYACDRVIWIGEVRESHAVLEKPSLE